MNAEGLYSLYCKIEITVQCQLVITKRRHYDKGLYQLNIRQMQTLKWIKKMNHIAILKLKRNKPIATVNLSAPIIKY